MNSTQHSPSFRYDANGLRASWASWVTNGLHRAHGPIWLQWLWTGLFCAALAVCFTVLGFFAFASGKGAWANWSGWLYWYGKNFIVCLTIGVTIHLMFDVARAWVGPRRVVRWRPWQRTLFFSGLPLLGVVLGWPVGVWLAGQDVTVWIGSREGNNIVVGTVLLSLGITFLLHHFFAAQARQMEAEKRATEAQLRLLQGQIEPHFLFNTLANVQSLMAYDVPKASQMLESFTDYLRGSLTALRHDQATLGSESDLAQAYLSLLQTRMEDRLAFVLDVPDNLRCAKLPPLMLQPLVENAIHHGLEPKIEGGQITVRARQTDGLLVLEVQDNGLGLDAPPRAPHRGLTRPGRGAGVALANLRERLLAQYHGEASLTLTPALRGTGTVATLTLPMEKLA